MTQQDNARIWRIKTFGDPDQLALQTTSRPEPGPHQVRVRVHAVGINRADLLQRMGFYPPPPGFDPNVPGLEYAGVVEKTGDKVQQRKQGDAVMGLIGGGAYAESLVVHEGEAIPVPNGCSFTEAAAIPEAFLTAYRAVFLEGGLQPGQWCLVRPATSGVGIAAVQLVHALGGRAIGSSRSAERLASVREYGLDGEVAEDGEDAAEAVSRITGGEGAAVLLDLLGGGRLAENQRCLRNEGTQVLVGLLAGGKDEINLGTMLFRGLTLKAMRMRSQPLERKIQLARIFADRLDPLFARGALRPVVDRVFPFEQAVEAHRHMEGDKHCGKLVLEAP